MSMERALGTVYMEENPLYMWIEIILLIVIYEPCSTCLDILLKSYVHLNHDIDFNRPYFKKM